MDVRAAIPGMFFLVKNLEESFEARANIGKPVEAKLRDDVVMVAALGRIATVIAQDIERVYDTSFLRETITQIKQYVAWMREETAEFQRQFEEESAKLGDSDAETLELRIKMLPHFMGFFDAKRASAGSLLIGYENDFVAVSPAVIRWLEKRYGNYATRVPVDIHSRWQLDKPKRFEELVSCGLRMKNLATTQSTVDRFAEELQVAGIAKRAPWLVHWIRGAVYYRSENYADALPYYKLAYESAKYSAGACQYKLVNQYLEISAKAKSWRDFKKAALWACYLGISVRWLRNDEPTDKNLKAVFKIMGMSKLQYATL